MEIALLSPTSLRIKDKNVVFGIDPQDKHAYNAAILLAKQLSELQTPEETVILDGPGEYEIGGVKIIGLRAENTIVYSLSIAGIALLLGNIKAIDKLQHKLKEHNIVVALCSEEVSASFVTSLASNVLVFYGEKAAVVGQSLSKENVQTANKYSVTKDKLPQEVETVLLV